VRQITVLLVLAAALTGCGGTEQKAEAQRPQRARHRQMATLVLAPKGAVPENRGARLAEHLAALYGCATTGAVRPRPFSEPLQYDDTLLTDLALLGVDDLFVFDLHPGQAGAAHGRLLLVKADTGKVLASRTITDPSALESELDAFCLAEHRFPDRRPQSDRFALGAELYRRRRYREAVTVLSDEMNRNSLDRLQDIKVREAIIATLDAATRAIAREDALLASRTARFGLSLGFNGVSPRFQSYFKRALDPSGLARAVRPLSGGAVQIDVQYDSGDRPQLASGAIFVSLRFDQPRYWAAVGAKPPPDEMRAFSLKPFMPVIEAALRFRDLAERFAPEGDRGLIGAFPVVIRLVHSNGAQISFSALRDQKRNNRPQPPLKLLYDFGDERDPVKIETGRPRVTSEKLLFFLDVPELVDGSTTEHALAFRFFGMAY